MKNMQLELGLNAANSNSLVRPPQRRLPRATWWFAQMRRMVDGALTWEQTHPARPEQTFLPGTHRQVEV